VTHYHRAILLSSKFTCLTKREILTLKKKKKNPNSEGAEVKTFELSDIIEIKQVPRIDIGDKEFAKEVRQIF
jgi:hypothetical protein